jgi:hypothetical protein
MIRHSRLLIASTALYGLLLHAYPAEHRREYGDSMLQLFRDLYHDAYCQGRLPGLAQVWIRTLWDVAKTAVIEHVSHTKGETLTMQNRPVTPTRWFRVLLTIAPGLVFLAETQWKQVLTATGRWGIPSNRVMLQQIAPSIFTGLFILYALSIVVGMIIERRIVVWSYPAIGSLSFAAFLPLGTLGFTENRWYTMMFVAIFLLLLAFVVYPVYRHKSRQGKILLGLFGLAFLLSLISVITFSDPVTFSDVGAIVWAYLPVGASMVGILFLPIAVGLLLARRSGPLAGLIAVPTVFVVAFLSFDPFYSVSATDSKVIDVYSVAAGHGEAIGVLLIIGLLVVAPIWVMRARSTRGQMLGLLLPAFVSLSGAEAIAAYACLHSSFAQVTVYSDGAFRLMRTASVVQFVVGLALAGVACYSVQKLPPAQCQEATGFPISGGA